MRTIFKRQERILEVGDTLPMHLNGEVEDVTILDMTTEYVKIKRGTGTVHSIYLSSFAARFPDVTTVLLPEVGYFNRITGHRLVVGDVLAGGTVESIFDDALRFRRINGEEFHRFVEVDPSLENLEWGVEIRILPSESELNIGLPRIVSINPTTGEEEYFVQIDGEQVPAADVAWVEGRYRRISECRILRGMDRRLVVNTAGMTRLEDNVYALDCECVVLADGRTVHMLDACPTQDGRVIHISEAVAVRNRHGDREYYSTVPSGVIELDGVYCYESHLAECAQTGEVLHRADCVSIDGAYVSRAWADVNARGCDECGAWFVHNGLAECECPNCRLHARTRIRNYSNRSAATFPPAKDVPIKFGIELEVGCDRGFDQTACTAVMAEALDAAIGDIRTYAVFKADGSLGDCNGFEIVTRPDCPSTHKQVWDVVLTDSKIARYMSSFDNGKCGMHIHVSRTPLSELWIGRLLVLVNSPAMQPMLHKIAGRGPNNYTTYDPYKKLKHGAGYGPSRYEALNTSGDMTIEFRIFRGTLNRASFLKNIEFVEAAIAFTRPAERSLREIGVPELFADFVSKSRKSYPYLFGFFKTKGLCKA